MNNRIIRIISVLFFLLSVTIAHSETKPYWVFFTDRGPLNIEKAVAAKIASPDEPKSVCRRARIMGKEKIFDERDLPVNPEYCTKVEKIAGRLRTVTRYFNGVSVELDNEALEEVKSLPFVKEVKPVKSFKKPPEPERSGIFKPSGGEKGEGLSYGNSFDQLNMIGVIGLHSMGYMGEGITISVLDSGFDNLEHAAFDSIHVSHKRDFVEGDDDPAGHSHGSEVLSIMAALDHGNMIGAAPYATYILARTEIIEQELRIEEDYWVAGIEWADSLGTDIVNSSLGYTEFDDETDYTYGDLDGETAITTIAADIAVAHGIVVVTSAGNLGDKPWHYITTPADGFNVFAVGGVDLDGEIVPSSSRGPTYDGRIKPDFVALGSSVLATNTATPGSYHTVQGTSFSSPAVSGAVALILEVNEFWGPENVKNALISTASRGVTNANTDYGYGIINTYATSRLRDSFLILRTPFGGEKWEIGMSYAIVWEGYNVDTITIEYSTDGGLNWKLVAYNVNAEIGSFDWTVPDDFSTLCIVKIEDDSGSGTVSSSYGMFNILRPVLAFKAYDPYPQPIEFNNGEQKVYFPVDIPFKGVLLIKIFNFAGENIQTIIEEDLTEGKSLYKEETPSWDGTNYTGDDVAPGIYYYRITFGNDGYTGKIAVIR